MITKPNKFVGLHGHSTVGSIGDSIGLPQEHIEFAISNGMDALALTDHGNCNGISHQQIKAADLKKKGVNFKAIPGIEAYFVDSLSDWKAAHVESKNNPAIKQKKAKKKSEESLIGNELAETEVELERVKESSKDDDNGTLVEIEISPEEAKNQATKGILYQRNHLVLLPKSSKGLKNIFKIVSESFIDGFYKYPRIDFDILKKYAEGEIIALSACIGGRLAKTVFDNIDDINIVSDQNFEKVQAELKKVTDRFIEILGPENYYAEIQFNKLVPQHLVNMHLIELSKRTGIKLVATADSHYSNPAHWREREIYKAMAWASKTKGTFDVNKLPQAIDDLKCELYPKNAEQMWETYQKNKKDYSFYDDQLVCDAIERTHDIAWNQIGDVQIDKSVKLPAITNLIEKDELESLYKTLGGDVDEDTVALKELVKLAIAGLKERGKANNTEYIDRLKRELKVIKKMKFSKYFLTYHTIMKETGKELFLGNGRGSAGGSLLAYILDITQVDPIKFGLLFERFLTPFKKSFPDIDCLSSNTELLLANNVTKQIKDIKVGDYIVDLDRQLKKVLFTKTRLSSCEDRIHCIFVNVKGIFGTILANHNHRLIDVNRQVVYVKDIKKDDWLFSINGPVFVLDNVVLDTQIELTDITVDGSSTFNIIPFNILIEKNNNTNRLISINTYSIDTDDYTKIEINRNRAEIKL